MRTLISPIPYGGLSDNIFCAHIHSWLQDLQRIPLILQVHYYQVISPQGLFDRFDDIVMAAGTGGTVAGLAIANYLTGSKVR